MRTDSSGLSFRDGQHSRLRPVGSGSEMYYVYALQSVLKKRLYIGQTKDLNKRLQYHNNGAVKSTSKDKPWKLIALQEVESINVARWIERGLKRSRGKRIKWIKERSF